MGCVLGCCLLCVPNTFSALEITDSIFKNLYEKYIRKFKKGFSFDTIHFFESDIPKKIKSALTKKLVTEFNKLNIKKYSFWTGYAKDYVSVQLAYYIFAKLINADYQFCIKATEMKLCYHEIQFDFSDVQIDEFKKSFFCKADGSLIDIETETNKAIHKALGTKLTLKLESIVDSTDLSLIIPSIIESYESILVKQKNEETEAFSQVLVAP